MGEIFWFIGSILGRKGSRMGHHFERALPARSGRRVLDWRNATLYASECVKMYRATTAIECSVCHDEGSRCLVSIYKSKVIHQERARASSVSRSFQSTPQSRARKRV